MFNINQDIQDFCKLKGWEPIATGGGCDYMAWCKDAGFLVILSDNDDIGFSVDGLLSKCALTSYYLPNDEEEWIYCAVQAFDNVLLALEYMNSANKFDLYSRALIAFKDEQYDFGENDSAKKL